MLTLTSKNEAKFNPCDFRENHHARMYELHQFVIYGTVMLLYG